MKINFWFLVQPFATLGFVKCFFSFSNSKESKNVFILRGQKSDRKDVDTKLNELTNINVYYIDDISLIGSSPHLFEDSINICFGFNSVFLPMLCGCKAKFKNMKVFVASELDTLGKILGKFSFLDYKARRFYKRFNSQIDGVLAFGDGAYRCFNKIGWKHVFQCHYLPDLESTTEFSVIEKQNTDFLYIGRNDFFSKRLNYLLKYFKHNKQLHLTIIGDYGPKNKIVYKKIKKTSNIHREATIPVQEVFDLICSKKYRCVLIPSRYDACNVNVYMCIMAGMPFICSTGTGEGNIAKQAECGFVFKNSYLNFKRAMSSFLLLDNSTINNLAKSTFDNKELSSISLMESLYNEIVKI